MTDFTELPKTTPPTPKFADFGLTEGIHYRQAPSAAPTPSGGDRAAQPKPAEITPATPSGSGHDAATPALLPDLASLAAPAAGPERPAPAKPETGSSATGSDDRTPEVKPSPTAGHDGSSAAPERGIKPAHGTPEPATSATPEAGLPARGNRPAESTPAEFKPAADRKPADNPPVSGATVAPGQRTEPAISPTPGEVAPVGSPIHTASSELPPITSLYGGAPDNSDATPRHSGNSSPEAPSVRLVPAGDAPSSNPRSPNPTTDIPPAKPLDSGLAGTISAIKPLEGSQHPAGSGAVLAPAKPGVPAPSSVHSLGDEVGNFAGLVGGRQGHNPTAATVSALAEIAGSTTNGPFKPADTAPGPTRAPGKNGAETSNPTTTDSVSSLLSDLNGTMRTPSIKDAVKPQASDVLNPTGTLSSPTPATETTLPPARRADSRLESGNLGPAKDKHSDNPLTTDDSLSVSPPSPGERLDVKPPAGRVHPGGSEQNSDANPLTNNLRRAASDILGLPPAQPLLPKITLDEGDKKLPRSTPNSIQAMLGDFGIGSLAGSVSPEKDKAPTPGEVCPPLGRHPVGSPEPVPAPVQTTDNTKKPGVNSSTIDLANNFLAAGRSALADVVTHGGHPPEPPKLPSAKTADAPRPSAPGSLTELPARARGFTPEALKVLVSSLDVDVPAPAPATQTPAPAELPRLRPAPSPAQSTTDHTTKPAPTVLVNLLESQTSRTAELALQGGLHLVKDAPQVEGPTVIPPARSLGDAMGAPLTQRETLPALLSNVAVIVKPSQQSSPIEEPKTTSRPFTQAALSIIAESTAENLLRRPGSPSDNGDPTKKAVATTGDGAPLPTLGNRLNNRVEDQSQPTPRPERAPVVDSSASPATAAPKPERASDNSTERPRAVGGVETPAVEASKPVFAQTGFKPSSLDRNTASAAQDVASKVVSLDAAKTGGSKPTDANSVYTFDSLKSSIIGLNGKNTSADSSVGKNAAAESNGLSAKLAGFDAVKTTAVSVIPLGIKRINGAGDSGIRSVDQTVGTVDGVKLDSLPINGLKTSLINFVSGKPLATGDKTATAKVEINPAKIEIPTAGIRPGVFINGATFNTSHGIAGSIKVDVAGVSKEGPIAISAVKDFSGKVESAIAGVKVDAISGVKDGGVSIIQVTTMPGKFANVDVTSISKSDATASNAGSISINGSNIQPTAQTIKGDVTGKVDATGRPIDGVKCNQQADIGGAVRGTALTPSFVNAIASAIRFGYPMPEGVALENGTLAVTYGNEVLYFPGLRAALKFAEVVGLIDADSEKVEEEKDEELLKPGVAANVRVRYTVKEGETLESIAETELSDARLSDLIMTINRSEILYRLTDAGKVPFVYPGQLILLPSEQELNIYRKNFFGKSGTKRSGMSNVSSAEITAEDESRESGRLVRKALHDEYIANNTSLQSGRPKTTIRDLPKFQLSFGEISPVITQDDQGQEQGYTHTVVNRPVTTEEHQTDNFNPVSEPVRVQDNRFLPQAADLSGAAIQQRSHEASEEAVFLHASINGDEHTDTVIVSSEPVIEMERLLDVRVLSTCARAIVTDLPRNPDQFFVRLEVRINDDWAVIASYDGNGDSTVRVRNAENGTKNSMRVNLPAHAVRAMAIEDFARNWSNYKTNYENNSISRIQVDSVQPTPVSFKGLAVNK